MSAVPVTARGSVGALRIRHPLAVFIGRRVLVGLLTVVVASVLIFLVVKVLPGNTAEVVLGRGATPERVEAADKALGNDRSILAQYADLFGHMVTGDLGRSTVAIVQGSNTRVSALIGDSFQQSLVLMAVTIVLFVPMVLILGLLAGLKAGSPRDTAISSGSLAISALPEFLIGNVLILVFFNVLDILPPISSIPEGDSALSHPKLLALPVLTLLLLGTAFGSRQLRASVAEVVSQDYVLTARINGYPWRRVIRHYVLPNAVVPSIQIIAQQIQYLIGGIIIVEAVFNYPGIGTVLIRAISQQDAQAIVVISTILAALYIAVNVLADVLAALADPRVRTSIS